MCCSTLFRCRTIVCMRPWNLPTWCFACAHRHRDVVVKLACTQQVVLHDSLGQHSGAVRQQRHLVRL
jgi:hypothetical protein